MISTFLRLQKEKAMKITKEEFLQKPYDDIIDDLNLDEMQKSETYKITFGLFRFTFWSVFIFSFAMLIFGSINEKSHLLSIFSILLLILDMGIYIVFAVRTSSKGIMKEKFASKAGNKKTVIMYLILAVMYINLFKEDLYCSAYIGILYVTMCIISVLAARNNKVLEKLNSDD